MHNSVSSILKPRAAVALLSLISISALASAAQPPAQPSMAPQCVTLTHDQAQIAFSRLKARLPSTSFDYAQPSEVCGMVRVQLQSGKVVYTDPTGRYMLLAFALDTHKGSPADISSELDEQIDRRQAFPSTAIPGLFPQD